ncbi:MAG: SDR family NAD(P)-dependent oxidoreductase [Desulfobacterales bacterium]|nr:SDR family NAD(P)-dependent oxidoreductase [Desulfobacterales bacterium]
MNASNIVENILVFDKDEKNLITKVPITKNPIDYNKIVPKFIVYVCSKENLTTDIYSIFNIFKTLISEKFTDKVQFLYVYSEGKDESNPQHNAISSFLKTVMIEHPGFICKTISLQDFNNAEDLLLRELTVFDGVEISYQNGERYIKKLKELEFKDENKKFLKDNGVYLITGGAGGLGINFAEYIAKQVKAKIALCGRSALHGTIEDRILELNNLGSEVIYFERDVSNQSDVDKLIKEINYRFGELSGIIHAAGLIKDNYIIKKNQKDIESVLAPKLYGSIYLDEATKEIPLDFFVLFSSLSAVIGNAGQSDYAYANSFMDSFAISRNKKQRFGRTVSINWPIWQEGGMQINKEALSVLSGKTGAYPLPSIEGLKAWEKIMSQTDISQAVIFYGDKDKIKSLINNDYIEIESFLKGILSDVLQISPDKIEPYKNFEEYGMSSIIVTRFNAKIENAINRVVPKTLLFEYQNLHDLVGFFAKEIIHIPLPLDSHFRGNDLIPTKVGIQNTEWEDLTPIDDEKLIQGRFYKGESDSDIAIIGISGIYPLAKNLEEYWENLKNGRNCITEIPISRWGTNYDKEIYCKWGGFLEDVDKFDPLFFNISPREAELMDPQERMFLEMSWSVLEDAGYFGKRLKTSRVGVFAGVTTNTYLLLAHNSWESGKRGIPSSLPWSIANRVSYFFNFQGPSIPIDTACSASISAIHMACMSLKQGECDMAIAGGVNLYLHPFKYIQLCQSRMLSQTGKCRSFGADGDGFVPGEGCGGILLKPLHQAVIDRDNIYGVIKGSSINHGGKTSGYTVPNPNAQASLILDALEKAKVNPETISYIEAHGTGTKLGDPVEIRGLTKAYRKYTQKKEYCPIGSVKSNIGHLESAAGIAGLTKILLQMKYKTIVPTLYCESLNPNINFSETPFYVQKELSKWNKPEVDGVICPRRAAISSFGAGGANAHLIVEEYEEPLKNKSIIEEPFVIILSAKNEERLKVYAERMLSKIEKENQVLISDLAYTLQICRDAMDERLAFIASSISETIEKLKKYIGDDFKEIYRGNAKKQINHELLVEGEEGEAFLKIIFNKKNLKKIAQLWVSGIDIDWNLLYKEKIKPLSLPTYPFEKERYWILDTKAEDRNTSDLTYYQSVWEKSGASLLNSESASNAILIFDMDESRLDILQKHLKSQIYIVKPGKKFAVLRSNIYEINPHNPYDYVELLKSVGEIETILHLWETRKKNLSHGVYSIFHLISAYNELKLRKHLKILYIFSPSPFAESVSGYSKSISLILPKVLLSTIEVLSGDITDIIIAELKQSKNLDEIRYEGKQRYIKSFKPINLVFSNILLKQNGVYLITGGLGALGHIFAKHLSKHYSAKIILTGRKAKIDSEFLYFQADIADFKRMKVVINEIKSKYKRLDGIIHAAGITNRIPIISKKEEEFKLTLKPKIQGLITLDLLTKNEHLDFFVMFSSTSSVLGDFGQCDYAVANRFLDSYAEYREKLRYKNLRHGKTIAINWPLWREGGMHQNQDGEDFYLKTSGMKYLETKEGIEAFEKILESDLSQVILMTGNLNKVKPENDKSSQIESDIKQIASLVVNVNPDRIDDNENLGAYGFDSVLLKVMADKISQKYNIEFSPAVFFEYSSIKRISDFLSGTFKVKAVPENIGTKINEQDTAIIGMSGIFPGSIDLTEFWQNLESEKDLISEVPKERWRWEDYFGDIIKDKNKTNSKWGGFISDVDKFDPLFFKISPREAEMMDPQQRLFLETVWKTLEDAGYKSSDLSGKLIGVFVGIQFNDYQQLIIESRKGSAQAATGIANTMIANRVSFIMNWHGPSEVIDTACSSSLVAVHRAIRSVRSGECEMAIAGGVSLLLSPASIIAAGQLGVLSPDGRCKTFDASANGYVKGEGVAAILIKPLSYAIKDNDRIYGLFKGSAVNHGGMANSLTSPNSKAQADVLISAYKDSGITPDKISYIEVHGTGTELGDPVEIEGLKKAFENCPKLKKNYCGLGTVKTNIGHLEPASGIAGVIKVILSIKNKKLPASLHLKTLNPYIKLDDSPFYIVKNTMNWDSIGTRIAGVSSFGFGGTNAHVVIEEYEDKRQNVRKPISPYSFQKKRYWISEKPEHIENIYYKPVWIPKTPCSLKMIDGRETVLMVYSPKKLDIEALIKEFHYKDNIIEIKTDDFSILEQIKELNTIYFLGGIQTQNINLDDLYSLDESQKRGVIGLFKLIKELDRNNLLKSNISLKVITNNLYSASLHGLTKVISKEYKHIKISYIDISSEYTTDLKQILFQDYGEEVFIRKGKAFVRSMEKVPLLENSSIPFKNEGVYLIIGGSGGIGLEFSKYLSKTVKAKLVLVGRKDLNEKQTEHIKKIEEYGGKVLYLKGDITDSARIKEIVETTKSYFGNINGVIHSAIVLRDKAIYNMDEESFMAVLSPKVKGSIVLYNAVKNEPLDFMLFFSSIQSFTGNPGQSNYAAASTFEDAFALYLNEVAPYPVKIINWSYWGSVGIVATEEHKRRHKAYGVIPIEPCEGMEAIKKIVSNPLPQIIVFKVETHSRASILSINSKYYEQGFLNLNKFGENLLFSAFQKMGVFQKLGEEYDKEGLKKQLEIIPLYNRLYDALINILSEFGWIKFINNKIIVLKTDSSINYEPLYELASYFKLLKICLDNYPDILTGKIPATDILFPKGSNELVEGIYSGNPLSDVFNEIVADAVNSYIENKRYEKINIIEIGAGTGGTTDFILPKISKYKDRIFYKYTDISNSFIKQAKARYKDFSFLGFGFLNIEKDINSQGYEADSFDIVIASNVLHGTKNIKNTIKNAKKLLKTNGSIIINETTKVPLFSTLTFGLLEGWWIFEDEEERLKDSPLLSSPMWKTVLKQEGFDRIKSLSTDNGSQDVIIAEKIGEVSANINEKILDCLSSVLQISKDEFNKEDAFSDLGVDSILAVEIIHKLNNELNINLRTTDLFNFPSINKLAGHISHKFKPQYIEIEKHIEKVAHGDIAIIGISGKFPEANNIYEFWDNLYYGKNSVKEVPKNRWSFNENNKSNYSFGGFISDIDLFDPLFFNISPKEAELMDPQQRLFLQEAWRCIEDAGYSPRDLDGKKCGVFVGYNFIDYGHILLKENTIPEPYAFTGNAAPILPARISYFLNLKGPAVSINTACSSSLVAVHIACESIKSGTSEIALAGGAQIMTTGQFHILAGSIGMVSKEGKCKTFDNGADGFVPGEAVGVVLLKSLEKALEDCDNIYGIIKGSEINQDGKTNGITAPNATSQTDLECEVYNKYNINPETISYIEAHGTATKLGDPIEIQALTDAFNKYTDKKQFCAIGAVKTNIGHTLASAGVSSLIKVLLCIKNKKLVPSINFEKENEHINFKDSPFYVNTKLCDWENKNDTKRRAAINAFGFSGTNCHMVVEEYNSPKTSFKKGSITRIVLSAKNEERLKCYAENMAQFLDKHKYNLSLQDIAYTLEVGREQMDAKIETIVSDIDELIYKLKQLEKFYIGKDDIKVINKNNKAKRVSLPTYPFAKESYWIKDTQKPSKKCLYYHPVWEKREVDIKKYETLKSSSIIFINNDEKLSVSLSNKLNTNIIYETPKKNYMDYVKLFNSLKLKNINPDTLLYLLSVDNISSYLDTGVYSVYYLIKAIFETKLSNLHRIFFFFNADKEENRPFMEAISGYSKSLSLIFPKLKLYVVQFMGEKESIEDIMAKELMVSEKERNYEVCYRENKRYVRLMKPLKLDNPQNIPLKQKGVYLITGGAGGLGLLFAKHLREKYKADIILTGRSDLTQEKEEKLNSITKVTYIKGDVLNLEDMLAVVKKSLERFGKIDGVIHAAGVVNSNPIIKKEISEFEAILKPKIFGTITIDTATKDLPLDFFVMFSSTSSVLGDFGQCDYAVANRFMDSYAILRESLREQNLRQGKTVSINWPLWAEGGMRISGSNTNDLQLA